MTNAAGTLEPFLQRREKNLNFFRTHYKDIYALFKDYKLQQLQVNILTENDEVNLIKDGRHIYEPGAKEYAREEVKQFRQSYREGKRVCSFIPPFYGDYAYPRFGQKSVNDLLEKSPIRKDNFRFYGLTDFYPLVVFLGCGLAYHIEEMVLEHDVHNLLVVEPDLDKFAASLYAVDWEAICSRYTSSNGKTIHFILGAEESEYLLWAVTWNKLIEMCPHFPINTLFYNHQGKPLFDKVSDRVNDDLIVYLLSWGHYDDELRQLNNALHNFHLGVKELPPPIEGGSDTPVFIVGSGPSLDGRIELIKKNRDKAIIISCGTSLKTLATYGVKPDIHVELESDLYAYIAVSQAADASFYKDVRLVGPAHISPLIYQLFDDSRMYYKAESALAKLFGDQSGHVIANATPTCTNLGVALAISMGFKRLFFFGLDFGFRDVSNHHAKGSIYYEKMFRQKHEEKDLIKVEAVNGGDAWTTPNYFTSKRKVENLLGHHRKDEDLKVYSCSDVSKIDHSQWLDNQALQQMLDGLNGRRQKDLDYIFSPNASTLPLRVIKSKLRYLKENFKALSHDVEKIVRESNAKNLAELSVLLGRLNWYVEDVMGKRTPDFYFFIRGALRHFMCVSFAHASACEDDAQRAAYIKHCKQAILQFVKEVPGHFDGVVNKKFDVDKDLWVKQSISDPENGINEFFTTPLEELRLGES